MTNTKKDGVVLVQRLPLARWGIADHRFWMPALLWLVLAGTALFGPTAPGLGLR